MHINQIFYTKFQYNTNYIEFSILNFNKDKIEKRRCQRCRQFVNKLSYHFQAAVKQIIWNISRPVFLNLFDCT
jgi:hypothetical protein